VTVVCQNVVCRYPASGERSESVVYLGNTADIVALFAGKLDALDCPVCAAKQSVTPSLLAISSAAGQVIHLDRGAGSEAIERLDRRMAEQLSAMGLPRPNVHSVADLKGFKDAVVATLESLAKRLPSRAPVDLCTPPETFPVHWESLHGEVFGASLIGALDAVPGLAFQWHDADGKPASPDDVRALFAEWIRQCLHLLMLSAQPLLSAGVPFERVLFGMIDASPLFDAVLERFLADMEQYRRLLGEEDRERRLPLEWFHLETLQAVACSAVKRENPYQRQFALELLSLEIDRQLDPRIRTDTRTLTLSPSRISRCVSYEAAWDAVAQSLNARAQFDALDRASRVFGYDGLLYDVLAKGIAIQGTDPVQGSMTPKGVAEFVLEGSQTDPSPGAPAVLLAMKVPAFSWSSDVGALEQLIDVLIERLQDRPAHRASALTWFGTRMNELLRPHNALARIGVEPAPWEQSLHLRDRWHLGGTRVNALSLADEKAQALKVAEEILARALEAPNEVHKVIIARAWQSVGVLRRESGLMQESLDALERSVELTDPPLRIGPLESLAGTLLLMGRFADAANVYATARKFCAGPGAEETRLTLVAAEAAARQNAGQRELARTLLDSISNISQLPTRAIPPFASVFASVHRWRKHSQADVRAAVELTNRIETVIRQAFEGGAPGYAGSMARAGALVSYAFSLENEESFWRIDAEAAEESGQSLHPITALEVARMLARTGKLDLAQALPRIQQALVHNIGGVELTPETQSALATLEPHFTRLSETLSSCGYETAALQAVADLRRNAHRQSVELRRRSSAESEAASAWPFPWPERCASVVAAGLPPFGVLEWVDIEGGAMCLITSITENGIHAARLTPDASFDVFSLASRVCARISGWRASRAGEPHAVEGWERFVTWIRASVRAHLAEGGHVVVIDHRELSALPHHIALAPEWTVSYAADWAAVHCAAQSSLPSAQPRTFGLTCIPRANESAVALAAFGASADRTRELVRQSTLSLQEVSGGAANAEEVVRLLASVDVMKILCHGQISHEVDVSLLVAHEGRLPPGNSFAAVLTDARSHRLGWRELAAVSRAAPVVFIGACSSGKLQVVGLDERVSVFTSLRNAGTRTVVAPKWKIDVERVLPVLDDVINRYVQGVPLARALNLAAAAALERGIPAWLAHAVSLEGSWI
jgi:hypothetical protein